MLFDRQGPFRLLAGLVLGAMLAALCAWSELSTPACWCAFAAGVCAVWWVTEALPLPATALVPLVLFPVAGVLDEKQAAQGYGHPAILLLMGGFFLSAAMERSGLHRRLALALLQVIGGTSGPRLIGGFMLATGLLSMWISNAATTLMMLPIALAVLQQTSSPGLRGSLLLGIAYASSIGGMATPVGTPPNVLFVGYYRELTGESYGFLEWCRVGFPIAAVLLPVSWILLARGVHLEHPIEMPAMGRWRPAERRMLVVFLVTAFAWVFRTAPAGGWVSWLGLSDSQGGAMIGDATVALAATLVLFLVPAGRSGPNGGALLNWETAVQIPWGILLLFGGGLTLARGFETSGLSESIGKSMVVLQGLPSLVIVLAICLLVNFLTELTSSTATVALLLPILGEVAKSTQLPIDLVMIAGTISASCAFMLPVATPPNSIVFGAGGIRSGMMARQGFTLNLISAILISLLCWLLIG